MSDRSTPPTPSCPITRMEGALCVMFMQRNTNGYCHLAQDSRVILRPFEGPTKENNSVAIVHAKFNLQQGRVASERSHA